VTSAQRLSPLHPTRERHESHIRKNMRRVRIAEQGVFVGGRLERQERRAAPPAGPNPRRQTSARPSPESDPMTGITQSESRPKGR